MNDPVAPSQSLEADTRHVALNQGLVRERTLALAETYAPDAGAFRWHSLTYWWCHNKYLEQPIYRASGADANAGLPEKGVPHPQCFRTRACKMFKNKHLARNKSAKGQKGDDRSEKNAAKTESEQHGWEHENATSFRQTLVAQQMRSGHRQRAQPRDCEGQHKIGGHRAP
jgi:hypothetical protein